MKRWVFVIALLLILLPGFSQDSTNNEDILLQKDSISIRGTLNKSNNADAPVVLIIAGSGPTDRNGNSMFTKNNCLQQLADSLAKYGIASLRYDKRFIGKSSVKNFSEKNLRFDDLVDDAADLINYLQQQKHYSTVFVLGHSEGSLIGMIASQNKKVKGFISAAGAGFKADSILKIQLASQPDSLKNRSYQIIDSLSAGYLVKTVPLQFLSLFRPSVQPYLVSWFKYDPAKEFKKLNCKKLVLQGNKDIQVSEDNAEQLYRADTSARFVLIRNMNHIFKTINGGNEENIASYKNPDLPVMSEMIQSIVAFIRSNKK